MDITLSKHQEVIKTLGFFSKLLKPNTARTYTKDILDFITSSSGWDVKFCIEYFALFKKQGFAKTLLDRKHAALSKFFQFLVENNLLQSNPFTTQTFKMFYKKICHKIEAESDRGSKKLPAKYLDWFDIEHMMTVCDNTLRGLRDKAVILLGTYEGLRRSEELPQTFQA